jgi:hypothetical protein
MVVMVGCNKRVREAASGEQRQGCYITLMNQNGEELFKSANDGKDCWKRCDKKCGAMLVQPEEDDELRLTAGCRGGEF